ncbi:hypothetical protein C0995_013845 [Termitomyces sp. Mi166|nr:hypothetical protein C0995_013845 [Termitomyces sp. Mi166\
MSGSGGPFPCISSNPDISGIGVRVAVYIQNFLSFVPAIAALRDGKVTFTELDSLETQSTTILITVLAILISTVIQAHMDDGITNYHASIVLNLSWMNNTNLTHLTQKEREDEDKSLDDLEWAAPSCRHWGISRVITAIKDTFHLRREGAAQSNVTRDQEGGV